MLVRTRLWLRSVLFRRRLEREMQEEMAEHLHRSSERLIARGLSPHDARQQARREFGNVGVLQEQARDARGAGWVESLAADFRFALRHFARTPGTTLTMFVLLAAGISMSTLLFAAVHSYAVQPPPGIERADDLVRIRGIQVLGADGPGVRGITQDEFLSYQALDDQFQSVAGSTRGWLPLVLRGDAERRSLPARVMFVTESYFSVLGVRPVIGPGLPEAGTEPAESEAVAVIAHATWEHLFARDPGVIGSTVTLAGVPITIVGVAPERFFGVSTEFERIQLWLPFAAQRQLLADPSPWISAIGRLRPDVGLNEASAAVRSVAVHVAASNDSLLAIAPSADVAPLLAMNGDPMFDRDVRLMASLVGLLGVLILLVTCTNVSALLTGLAAARRQEISIRLALGAARARLVRQLMTESLLLATAAGLSALGLVWIVLRTVSWLLPGLPFQLGITWPATTFTFAIALAVGLIFGLSPALHGTRIALSGALHESSGSVAGGRGRLQRGLVIAQVTFTQPLIALLATVLLIVLGELQPGRQTELGNRLAYVQLRPSPAMVEEPEELRSTMHRLTARLEAMPGMETVMIDWPDVESLGSYIVHPEDRVSSSPQEPVRLVGWRAAPGYFAAVGIPVVRGHEFAPGGVAPTEPRSAHVEVIVGTDLARRLWPGANPVGRQLRAASDSAHSARTLTVVGVIDDPAAATRRSGESVRVYLPPDTTQLAHVLLLRTRGDASSQLPAVRTVVHEEAPQVLADIRTLAEIEDAAQRIRRLATSGVSAAGVMSLLLSAIGLYAVVAFSVSQRTREIAVRKAIGASSGRIVRRFVADGVTLGAIGLVLGLPVSLVGLRMLLAADNDFPALPLVPVAAIAALGVLATATLAAWFPARRAAEVDPAVTLRVE